MFSVIERVSDFAMMTVNSKEALEMALSLQTHTPIAPNTHEMSAEKWKTLFKSFNLS